MSGQSKQPLPRREAPARSGAFGRSRLVRALRGKLTGRPQAFDGPAPLEELARARLGQVLRGKYQLERVLGVGGMATVYAATHRNRRTFAIKMLHPELSLIEAVRTRFQREGYVTNSVNHPGTVAVLDDDVAEDGSAFLVMELLDGVCVDELWDAQGQVVPAEAAVAIADQVLDVLIAAHAQAVVHRDLKPANLFLTRDGGIKVLDFGVARLRESGTGQATRTGTTLGTPAYMAPEQAFGKTSELDETADLWALGASMFALISGKFVHDGDERQQLVARLSVHTTRSLASVARGVPPALVRVIDRALATDKHERWPSAKAMREALHEAHLEAFGTPLTPQHGRSTLAQLLAVREGGSGVVARARLTPRPPLLWIALALALTALAMAAALTSLR